MQPLPRLFGGPAAPVVGAVYAAGALAALAFEPAGEGAAVVGMAGLVVYCLLRRTRRAEVYEAGVFPGVLTDLLHGVFGIPWLPAGIVLVAATLAAIAKRDYEELRGATA